VARIALLLFMVGFAFGRMVSFAVDGIPHILLVGVFAIEVMYSCAVLYLMSRDEPRA
jgi:hypothetical protein